MSILNGARASLIHWLKLLAPGDGTRGHAVIPHRFDQRRGEKSVQKWTAFWAKADQPTPSGSRPRFLPRGACQYQVSSLLFKGRNCGKLPDQVRLETQAARIQGTTLPRRYTAGRTGYGGYLLAGECAVFHWTRLTRCQTQNCSILYSVPDDCQGSQKSRTGSPKPARVAGHVGAGIHFAGNYLDC